MKNVDLSTWMFRVAFLVAFLRHIILNPEGSVWSACAFALACLVMEFTRSWGLEARLTHEMDSVKVEMSRNSETFKKTRDDVVLAGANMEREFKGAKEALDKRDLASALGRPMR